VRRDAIIALLLLVVAARHLANPAHGTTLLPTPAFGPDQPTSAQYNQLQATCGATTQQQQPAMHPETYRALWYAATGQQQLLTQLAVILPRSTAALAADACSDAARQQGLAETAALLQYSPAAMGQFMPAVSSAHHAEASITAALLPEQQQQQQQQQPVAANSTCTMDEKPWVPATAVPAAPAASAEEQQCVKTPFWQLTARSASSVMADADFSSASASTAEYVWWTVLAVEKAAQEDTKPKLSPVRQVGVGVAGF
jgi:hypothetical protein